MSKLWVKNGVKNFVHMGPFVPPLLSNECMYLKNDVTKKWLFCLIKGVFEMGLLR